LFGTKLADRPVVGRIGANVAAAEYLTNLP